MHSHGEVHVVRAVRNLMHIVCSPISAEISLSVVLPRQGLQKMPRLSSCSNWKSQFVCIEFLSQKGSNSTKKGGGIDTDTYVYRIS